MVDHEWDPDDAAFRPFVGPRIHVKVDRLDVVSISLVSSDYERDARAAAWSVCE